MRRAERGVERGTGGIERGLPLLVDQVDLGVVGDGFQRDVRHAFQHEALADVAVERSVRRGARSEFRFLRGAFAAVAQQVGRVARGHQPRAREGERDARRIDGDPATAPLFGDVGGGAGAAGGVEHEVAGIGGHQHAALDDQHVSLHHIHLVSPEPGGDSVGPQIADWKYGEVINKPDVAQGAPSSFETTCSLQA